MDKKLPEPFGVLLRGHSPEELWAVRSHVRTDLPASADTDALLNVSRDYYEFMVQIRSAVSSADFTKLARTIELGKDGLGLLDEVMFDDETSFREMIALVLMAGADYLESSALIQASMEVSDGLVNAHRIRLYDHCWDMASRMRRGRETGEGLDRFFGQVFTADLPLTQRVTLTFFLYRFLCVINYWMAVKKR